MMLKVLPENISNLIAAGEVVSRPASIVKELVENSVDAGASSITVVVSDSGRTSITVIDDGCGMSADEARLCFERHATSKISEASDLEHIMTYGFRGEALPSIASVAEVTLKSRRADDEVGVKVEMASSRFVSSQPCAAPKGTSIEVRNLFYNVPARRKFLKSDASEMRLIISEFLRVAIIRQSLTMRLVSGGKDIYNLRPAANLKQRIRDIFGDSLTKGLAQIEVETSVVRVNGFIGAPEDAQKGAGKQYLFVNGRFFRSPYLNKAVCKPYEKLVPEGNVPCYFLFLETDPERVDVNIHPAKTEVKFEDEQMIFEIVSAAVREALGRNSLIPSIDFDQKGAPAIPTIQSTRTAVRSGGYVAPPRMDFNPLFDPFREDGPRVEEQRLFKDSPVDDQLLVVGNRYIITRSGQGIAAVSISRARERVFYERYLEQVMEKKPVVSHPLFPEIVNLDAEDLALLRQEASTVSEMGFDLQEADGSVRVCGLPEGFSSDREGAGKAVEGLIAALKDDTLTDDYRQGIASHLSRSAAASRSGFMSVTEARSLLDRLYACRCPGTTSDGRRITSEITLEEIERKL